MTTISLMIGGQTFLLMILNAQACLLTPCPCKAVVSYVTAKAIRLGWSPPVWNMAQKDYNLTMPVQPKRWVMKLAACSPQGGLKVNPPKYPVLPCPVPG